MWNVTPRTQILKIPNAHTDTINAFEQLNYGSYGYLVSGAGSSGSDQGAIKIWDTENGTLLYTMTNPLSPVTDVLCLEVLNCSHMANWHAQEGDNTNSYIVIWNMNTHTQSGTLTGHNFGVNVLFLLVNGMLASGANDGLVKGMNNIGITVSCLQQLDNQSIAVGGNGFNYYFFNTSGSQISSYTIMSNFNLPCNAFLLYNGSIMAVANKAKYILLYQATTAS